LFPQWVFSPFLYRLYSGLFAVVVLSLPPPWRKVRFSELNHSLAGYVYSKYFSQCIEYAPFKSQESLVLLNHSYPSFFFPRFDPWIPFHLFSSPCPCPLFKLEMAVLHLLFLAALAPGRASRTHSPAFFLLGDFGVPVSFLSKTNIFLVRILRSPSSTSIQ